MRKGVFAAFPSAHGKQVRFFHPPFAPIFRWGRWHRNHTENTQEPYRENIKAGSIKFHF